MSLFKKLLKKIGEYNPFRKTKEVHEIKNFIIYQWAFWEYHVNIQKEKIIWLKKISYNKKFLWVYHKRLINDKYFSLINIDTWKYLKDFDNNRVFLTREDDLILNNQKYIEIKRIKLYYINNKKTWKKSNKNL